MIGRGFLSYKVPNLFPILRLGGKLVTGHTGPFPHRDLLRDQNIPRMKTVIHDSPPTAGTACPSRQCRQEPEAQ
jgi:hypothetical protein